jgi:hypothetical protein
MDKLQVRRVVRILLSLGAGWVFYRASVEFQQIASGTGTWLGEFSRTWTLLYFLFVLLCAVSFFVLNLVIWRSERFSALAGRMASFRERIGNLRWLLWLAALIVPIWFFQQTVWGVVFHKFYIRLIISVFAVGLLTFLSSRGNILAGWGELLASLIVIGSAFSIAASLNNVTHYPFSLGWSEGNRLWDYSVLFGRGLYDYPAGGDIPVLIDFGRQVIGGFPFLFPGVTISVARLWVGLTLIVPYLLVGFALFRQSAKDKALWTLAALWVFLFLKQGPIHPPLLVCAFLVALAWKSPLKFAIPLVIVAGYFAQASRFTWIFAPGIWIVMLEFASASFSDRESVSTAWKRSLTLGFFGIFGGLLLPHALAWAWTLFQPAADTVTAAPPVDAGTALPVGPALLHFIIERIQDQPLLWYRLLPNSTYGYGILLALLFAAGPLLAFLVYLYAKNIWRLERLQKLALLLPLLVFLAVGLVISTKIGGGGDLHNMDMFLIGMLFAGALAFYDGGLEWLKNPNGIPPLMKAVVGFSLVFAFTIPMMGMRSNDFGDRVPWLMALTNAPNEAALGMFPPQEEIDAALQLIQEEVDQAKLRGEVLFMDQRQLLTFGYIKDVPLVPEYEKKRLMDESLSGNAAYFEPFYADLAAHRFSLILSEPLRTPIQDSSYRFGEENNAWVTWVAGPVLCYYEPLVTLRVFRVQLLVPNENADDCSSVLPN